MRIDTSAPTRIDLGGGTLDIWPLYLFHPGAQTLNAAISLRARVRIDSRGDDRVVIRSEDTGAVVEADDWHALRDAGTLRLLSLIAVAFEARGVTITSVAESPAGAGIAGSSALTVACCAALAEWRQVHYEPEALLQLALNVEAQAIGVPTGLQDYRPALYGGIAALELGPEGVRRVPLDIEAEALERRMVLCYTGTPRQSGITNWEITKRHIDGDTHVRDCMADIVRATAAMRTALSERDWNGLGEAIVEEWEHRKRLVPGVTTPAIERLITDATAAGATAAKVCGAGGGGCLFCYGPPERREAIAQTLSASGGRLLNFRIEPRGLIRG